MNEKQRKELVVKMKKLIEDSGVSKDELPGIIEEAQKKRPTPKQVKAKQVKTFIDLGYPEAMGISEKKFKDLVSIPEDKPGALLVISSKAVSIFAQLNLVDIYAYLDLAELKDVVETSELETSEQSIYWIYDVEDGTKMLGKSPENCRRIFKEQNRRGLTVAEAIALIVQNPEILENHYIDISGSCYDSDVVPFLLLNNGRPRLGCSAVDNAGLRCGSASCGN